MKLITTFTGDYFIRLSTGVLLELADIEREVWWDENDGDQIYYSPESCLKIEAAIEAAVPGYFDTVRNKHKSRNSH